MRFTALSLALAGATVAQNVSVCDKYTTALLSENNATNQYTLLTLLVNTVVIGNYTTTPPPKNAVPGILANGTFNGTAVNLLPYFDGTLKSTNRKGVAVSINFLDDGGAEPLKKNLPANGTTSNQYKLLTRLYQFFGALLGCSAYATPGFPAYEGRDMASAHAFMALDPNELGYFIQQVGLAATSFGVEVEDVAPVAEALGKLFGYRCSPPTVVIPAQGPTLNSICQAADCPLDAMATCAAYPNNGTVMEPQMVGAGNGSAVPTGTGVGGPGATGTGVPGFEGTGAGRGGWSKLMGVLAFIAVL